jgi:predicted neuraminidase
MPQLQVFYFFLVLMAIVALVCAWVGLSTRQARDVDSSAAYKLRFSSHHLPSFWCSCF